MNLLDIPITILADDLTGAAEVAGILRRFGYAPRLIRAPDRRPERMTCVIDADSRLLGLDAAARRVADALHGVGTHEIVFKKIDSLLRGPIGAEIDAAMDSMGRPTALVLAQNPSRGRCVAGGRYTIDGVPLHQTSFRTDPEYPRFTDEIVEYVQSIRRDVVLREPGDALVRGAINVASAVTLAEIDAWVDALDQTVLPVGAADLLTSFVRGFGLPERPDPPIAFGLPRLIVAGSASAYARSLPAKAVSLGIPAVAMCADESDWIVKVSEAIRTHGITLMHVGGDVIADRQAAEEIQSRIARCVACVLQTGPIADLMVDGGATASAVIREVGWHDLLVLHEIAPGVITLEPTTPPRLTIKPGSYAWPDAAWAV